SWQRQTIRSRKRISRDDVFARGASWRWNNVPRRPHECCTVKPGDNYQLIRAFNGSQYSYLLCQDDGAATLRVVGAAALCDVGPWCLCRLCFVTSGDRDLRGDLLFSRTTHE